MKQVISTLMIVLLWTSCSQETIEPINEIQLTEPLDLSGGFSRQPVQLDSVCPYEYKVNLFIHRVTSIGGATQTVQQVDEAIAQMTENLLSANILPIISGTDVIQDPDLPWFLNTSPRYFNESDSPLLNLHDDAIDVFILPDEFYTPNGNLFPLNGEAGSSPSLTCYFGSRANGNPLGVKNIDNNVFTHELGHCLGLGPHSVAPYMDVMNPVSALLVNPPSVIFTPTQISTMKNTIKTSALLQPIREASWISSPAEMDQNSFPLLSGRTLKIIWDASKYVNTNNVKITLYRDCTPFLISQFTPNNGRYDWQVPFLSEFPAGGGLLKFQIRVESTTNSDLLDYSGSFSMLLRN